MRHRWLITAAVASALAPSAHYAYATEFASVETARRAAFPAATAFEPFVVSADVKTEIAREAGRFVVSPQIWRVRAGDTALGWFIVDEVIGKVEWITYGVALDASGTVKSVDVLVYRESHGDAIGLPAWRAQFAGLRASNPVQLGTDIRNISGATLSCRHVTEGVHRLLLLYDRALSHG